MTFASVSSYNLSSPMLFPPEPSERIPTARGPRSTTSRATTRRHRSNRSHHGGSSYAPQNEFPYFAQSGDVEIIINADGQEKIYMLHRLILAQNSGFFEASTSEEWSRAQAQSQAHPQPRSQASELDGGLARVDEDGESLGGVGRPAMAASQSGPMLRWRYELDGGAKDDEVPMLVQKARAHAHPFETIRANIGEQPPVSTLFGGDYTPKPPPPRSKPPASSTGFFRSMANFSAMQSAVHLSNSNSSSNQESEIIRDYDNLFRIFYNYPPELDSMNIAEAYVQCKTLLSLADMYDALDVVGQRCDYHLLRFQGRLWKQIAKYPPSYLKLGYLARSKVIFAEAIIHVVGQWPTASTQLHNHLPESVLDVIEDKVGELEDLKAQIEGRLFRLTLTTSKGERVTPSNSYLDWTAVSLFRQWLAENTTPPPPPFLKLPNNGDSRRPPPPKPQPSALNTGRIYRLLGTGGQSYLGHDDLKRFIKISSSDYSRDSLRKFEKRMDEIKSLAKDLVRPLMKNHLELDLGRDGGALGYLTCTKLEEADFPWD